MNKFKLMSATAFVLAGVMLASSAAHADGDKKNRLCRHLKMIYLLNSGSSATDTAQVKEKYGELDCGQMSFSLEGSPRNPNSQGNQEPTITAVTKVPADGNTVPTIAATDTAQ